MGEKITAFVWVVKGFVWVVVKLMETSGTRALTGVER
jgi:hypothetical protein